MSPRNEPHDDYNPVGHDTGSAGERLPKPPMLFSLALSYPRALFCSTFLYMEGAYALKNVIFCISALWRLVAVLLFVPAAVISHYCLGKESGVPLFLGAAAVTITQTKTPARASRLDRGLIVSW